MLKLLHGSAFKANRSPGCNTMPVPVPRIRHLELIKQLQDGKHTIDTAVDYCINM